MMQFAIIGIGAGAAAALLFASVTSGAWLSIPLFYLAPLPIMIAGLGWSHWAASVAALAGALALGVAFGPVFFFSFLAGAGLPAWWLSYLAMLARPAGNGAAALEWYPPGRLVVWAAILGGLVVVAAIPNFGFDAESFHAGLRHALTHILRVETDLPANAPLTMPGVTSADRLVDFLVSAIPSGSGGARHHHQCAQSVACRLGREVFRPVEAAVAATFGHDVSAFSHGGAGDRHRLEFCR